MIFWESGQVIWFWNEGVVTFCAGSLFVITTENYHWVGGVDVFCYVSIPNWYHNVNKESCLGNSSCENRVYLGLKLFYWKGFKIWLNLVDITIRWIFLPIEISWNKYWILDSEWYWVLTWYVKGIFIGSVG